LFVCLFVVGVVIVCLFCFGYLFVSLFVVVVAVVIDLHALPLSHHLVIPFFNVVLRDLFMIDEQSPNFVTNDEDEGSRDGLCAWNCYFFYILFFAHGWLMLSLFRFSVQKMVDGIFFFYFSGYVCFDLFFILQTNRRVVKKRRWTGLR
jgi:hypothetical protein